MNRIPCRIFKREGSPFWQLRYRLPGELSPRTKSLGVRDKQTAEKRRLDFITETERELAGIAPKRPIRETAKASLAQVLEDFISDLHAKGRDALYQENMRRYVLIPAKACGWSSVGQITVDSFTKWRSKQANSKSARTLNHYFEGLRAFLNWLVNQERLPENPLLRVSKVKETKRVRERRALDPEQAAKLLDVAPPERRLVYLLGLHTGLRRAEMKALEWRDVYLDSIPARILPRAETVKNGKAEPVVIHPELEAALRTERAKGFQSVGKVVRMFSRLDAFKRDLKAAGIPFLDDHGRRVDLHALRKTFNTRMAVAGVPTRIAMQAMRHSEERLTTGVYTDSKLLPVAYHVQALPSIAGDPVSPVVSPFSVSGGPEPAEPVTVAQRTSASQDPKGKEVRRNQSRPVKVRQSAFSGSGARDRT
jgi:integrase